MKGLVFLVITASALLVGCGKTEPVAKLASDGGLESEIAFKASEDPTTMKEMAGSWTGTMVAPGMEAMVKEMAVGTAEIFESFGGEENAKSTEELEQDLEEELKNMKFLLELRANGTCTSTSSGRMYQPTHGSWSLSEDGTKLLLIENPTSKTFEQVDGKMQAVSQELEFQISPDRNTFQLHDVDEFVGEVTMTYTRD
jgi:hypothetical protein